MSCLILIKIKKLLIVGLLAVVLFFGLTGRADAVVTITKDFDLVFSGVIVQGATRTVAPAGGGTGGSAQFTIRHSARHRWLDVTVTVPPNMVITRIGGAETMTVTLTPGAGQTGSIRIDRDRGHIVHVGGSVTAGAIQIPGTYTGTFTITVTY